MTHHIIIDLGEDNFWVGDVWYPDVQDTILIDIGDVTPDVLGIYVEEID